MLSAQQGWHPVRGGLENCKEEALDRGHLFLFLAWLFLINGNRTALRVRTRHGRSVGNAVGSNLCRVIRLQVRRSMVELRLLSALLYKHIYRVITLRYLAFLFRCTVVVTMQLIVYKIYKNSFWNMEGKLVVPVKTAIALNCAPKLLAA